MSKVKGTKLYPLKVVEHHPVRQFFHRVLLLAFFAASIAGSFYYGYYTSAQNHKQVSRSIKELTAELREKNALLAESDQIIANIKLGSQVDRKANEDVRQEVILLKEEMAKLQEENSFYRNLMAPSGNKRGLTFGSVEVVETETSRQYAYKVVMQQLATNHILLKGSLTFTVVGRTAGVEKSYKLAQISENESADTIRLRFKYFQTIEGKLMLPAQSLLEA